MREVMEVDMQQSRLRHLDKTAQRRLDMLEIVETVRADQVDDEMRAGETLAVALDEEIRALVGRCELTGRGRLHFLRIDRKLKHIGLKKGIGFGHFATPQPVDRKSTRLNSSH